MQSKTIAWFFVKVIALYAVLMLPWFDDAYASAFRAGANVFFRNVGDTGRAYFRPNSVEHPTEDTTVEFGNLRVPGARGAFEIDTRNMGYLATAFLISLILATPIPWSRRLIGLLIGLALISVFAAFRLYLQLVDVYSQSNPLSVYTLSPFWQKGLLILKKVLSMTPVTMYIAPVFVWILVCFRRSDLARFVRPTPSVSPPVAERKRPRAHRA